MGNVFTCIDPAARKGLVKPLSSQNMPSWLVMDFELKLLN